MKNITVDIGNYNIKYIGDKKGIFSSKYSNRFEPNSESFDRIEINGIVTLIGVGEFEREYNKSEKNVLPQVLYAISQATNHENINLCLLMPINQITMKDTLIEKFKGKSFKVVVNGNTRTIIINNCTVLPECQAAYSSLILPSNYQLIIDIGSRTINWCAYEEGKKVKNGTEKLGIYDLYDTIMTIENSRGEDYTVERIESQIKRQRILVDDLIYKEFLINILNRVKANVNIKDYDVVFIGGGSKLLESLIKNIQSVIKCGGNSYGDTI